MAQTAEVVTFKMGDTIFSEKDRCSALYIVKVGQIEVYKSGKNGERIPLAVVNSGEYLGEMAIFSDNTYSATALCLTDVTAAKFPREVIENQLKNAPPWLVALARGLVLRLKQTNELLRKNNIQDETILNAVKAIEENEKIKRAANE